MTVAVKSRNKADAVIYETIEKRIIAQLKDGVVPWKQSWKNRDLVMPRNYASRKEYRGINVFVLTITAMMEGYPYNYWMTFNQARTINLEVKAGEEATPVLFWKWVEVDNPNYDPHRKNSPKKKRIPFMRYFNVFNVSQVDGMTPEQMDKLKVIRDESVGTLHQPIDSAKAIVDGMPNAPRLVASTRPSYVPATDWIRMPAIADFDSAEDYYSTRFHEMVHSTGHSSRLNRKEVMERQQWGDSDYSREELVAEMGAAMLCGVAGIEQAVIANQAAYIAGWLEKIGDDHSLVISAASRAQKACDYIRGVEFTQEAQ